jgi:uncharacterized protein (TIGR02118 family)
MSVAAFQDYWLNTHAAIVCRMPEVRRYVQSHTRAAGYRNRTPAYDGVAELWFDDSDALRTLAGGPELQATKADHHEFMDMSSYTEFVGEDVVIKDGSVPSRGVKNIEVVRRKPGMDPKSFHEYWENTHGPLARTIPQLRRYVQCHTRMSAYRDGKQPDIDGVAMTWFENTDEMRASATTPAYQDVRNDEKNFLFEPLDFIIVEEKVIVA